MVVELSNGDLLLFGGAQAYDTDLTPNNLVLGIELGTVTVATT